MLKIITISQFPSWVIRIFLMLCLSSLLLFMLLGKASASRDAAAPIHIIAQETDLDLTGTAYEINPDTQGNLWVSDDGASQIRQIHPASGVYTIYPGMTNASDAHRDGEDQIWWTDSQSTNLGRLSLSTSTVTTWTLPGSGVLWGVAFDNAGHVWSTDFADGKLYRFMPSTHEVCTYPVPKAGVSDYLVASGGTIWLADWANDRVLNLDPTANVFTHWQLTGAAYPQGLALEANGNLWWADEDQHMLARLEPGIDQLTAYTLPFGTMPAMLALSLGKVWYTESLSRTIGTLDPNRATGAISILSKDSSPVTPTCVDLGSGTSNSVTPSTHPLEWTTTTYTRTNKSDGWIIYELPALALPWGITVGNGDVWVVDQDRHKLLKFPEMLPGTISGHIFEDSDGNGTQNGSEAGLAGVQVLITDTLGTTHTVTSNASGDYSVTVVAGSTLIDVVDSTLPTGTLQTVGNDPTTVIVTENEVVSEIDGYQLRGTLSGHIFGDSDGSGTQNGSESGLAGVQVLITDTLGITHTVTSNASGDYSITVAVGSTIVDIVDSTLPVGVVQTAGSDPTTFQVSAGETATDLDGYHVVETVRRVYLPLVLR